MAVVKHTISLLVAAAWLLPATQAAASASGQARAQAQCDFCHNRPPNNVPPAGIAVFQADGNPYSLPGQQDRYVVRIAGGNERAGGFALWASEGFLEPDPQSPNRLQQQQERFQGDTLFEVTHQGRGNANADGNVEWYVLWTPPDDGTTEARLIASGISANANGGTSGDINLHVERTIPIECPDADLDGRQLAGCGGDDCDDTHALSFPGADEICDGRDNDCNNTVDDGFEFNLCPLQDGVCAGSRESCNDNGRQVCGDALYGPGFERNEVSCDGIDNDCDGTLDELLNAPGGTCPAQGVCNQASARCLGQGGWTCDYPDTHERNETRCDQLDNDCDGQTDEGCNCQPGQERACGTDEGDCSAGNQTCAANGNWGPCVGEVRAVEEQCDGRDNDCDAATDEELPGLDCDLRAGVCAGANRRCGGGQGWLPCDASDYGDSYERVESACGDGLDNDCDGTVDDGCPGIDVAEGEGEGDEVDPGEACEPGRARPCGGTSEGACQVNVQICEGNAQWSRCGGGINPVEEICGDGKDNDCDGKIDENEAPGDCAGRGAVGPVDEAPGEDPDDPDLVGDEDDGNRAPVDKVTTDEGLCAVGPVNAPRRGLSIRALLRR